MLTKVHFISTEIKKIIISFCNFLYKLKLGQETMATSKNPVKTGDINMLITSQFHPDINKQKKEYSEQLKDLFRSLDEFSKDEEREKVMKNLRKVITENTANLKQFNTKIEKLAGYKVNKLRQEALNYSINTEGLSDENLRDILVNRVSSVAKNVSNVLEENKKKYELLVPLETDFQKRLSSYVANHKKEFRAWKLTNMPDTKDEIAKLRLQKKSSVKKSPEYFNLDNQIKALEDPTDHLLRVLGESQLSDFTKTAYSLRLRKDRESSQSTRFSNSGRYIGAYVREIMTDIVNGLVSVNSQRYKALVASVDNVSTIKPVIELADFDVTRFPSSVYKTIYELLVDTKNLTPILEGTPCYGVLCNVSRYVKSRKTTGDSKIPAVHQDVVLVIAHTISKFIIRLCELIQVYFKRSHINTIQEKVVRLILDPYFKFAGVEHPVIITKPSKKRVVSPALSS